MKREIGFCSFIFLFLFLCLNVFSDEVLIQPLKDAIIVLDAGNGAEAILPNAVDDSQKSELSPEEAKINAKIASYLTVFLEQAGAKVFKTSNGASIEQRAAEASEKNPHFIISINQNYSKNPEIDFSTAYYGNSNKEISVPLASEVAKALSAYIKTDNMGGQYFNKHYFLTDIKIPTIVLCCSFITNKQRFKIITGSEAPRDAAIGILNGVINFWKLKKDITINVQKNLKPESIIPKPAEEKKVDTSVYPAPPSVKSSVESVPPPPLQIDKTSTDQKVKGDESKSENIPFNPPFLNPVKGPFDQSWLFGESYSNLPVKKSSSFNVPENTNILAVAEGEVIEVNTSGNKTSNSSYPNYIILKHNEKLKNEDVYTLYGNVNGISVKQGDKVMKGQPIGKTGKAYSVSKNRDSQFEFEIRIGDNNIQNIRNPEMYLESTTTSTGIIIGKVKDRNGVLCAGMKITGAQKPDSLKPYSYSMTYGQQITVGGEYSENLVISDVKEGKCTLICDFGSKEIEVKAGMITFVDWTISK